MYQVLVAFAAFHAICTIAFWLFPALYAPVKAAFFSSSYMASDYRSGFTAHYSTNSIYLSFGLVCWACGLIGEKSKPRAKDIILGVVLLLSLFLTTKRGPLVASVVAVSICYLFVNRDKFTGTALKALIIVMLLFLPWACWRHSCRASRQPFKDSSNCRKTRLVTAGASCTTAPGVCSIRIPCLEVVGVVFEVRCDDIAWRHVESIWDSRR